MRASTAIASCLCVSVRLCRYAYSAAVVGARRSSDSFVSTGKGCEVLMQLLEASRNDAHGVGKPAGPSSSYTQKPTKSNATAHGLGNRACSAAGPDRSTQAQPLLTDKFSLMPKYIFSMPYRPSHCR